MYHRAIVGFLMKVEAYKYKNQFCDAAVAKSSVMK
jgi:hypothetical protein